MRPAAEPLAATEPAGPAAADASSAAAPTLYLETVGCQMNVLDSELVVAALRRAGYALADRPEDADAILFNTCSVRQHAEDKVYSALGRLKRLKDAKPDAVIGVIGCMAQKDQALIFRRAPHVDLICSPGQLARIPELLRAARGGARRQQALGAARTAGAKLEILRTFESYDPLREPDTRPNRHQAFVRLQMGCDKFCTYCIVPSVRGPEQGRDPAAVVDEVRRLAADGVREVTFVGQTVNSYRHVAGDGRVTRLSDLLAAAHDVPGIARLKFVTNYPRDMTDDLLDAVRSLPRVSQYLHVPAQSGCDAVLKAMKRGYTVGQYWEMLHRVRERLPRATVSSDFIVGFPGESAASFDKTADLVRAGKFKNSFVFKYSPREGTKSFALPDDVPEEEKKRRNQVLLALQEANSKADGEAQLGSVQEVLVEGESKLSGGAGPTQLSGRTREDRIVHFFGNPRLAGTLATVRIDAATPYALVGEIVTRDLAVFAD
jgi:tRNA-2-methylthio-N6-dimethylallyladenosine synthase